MKRFTVATIAALMLACVLPMARAREAAPSREERVSEQDAQLSRQMAELKAQLDRLQVEQEQLQNHLRALAEKRQQVAAQRRPAEGPGDAGGGRPRERGSEEIDVTIAPRNAPARVGGDGQPERREPGVQAHTERARAEVERVRAQREAQRAASESRRVRLEVQGEQEWANLQRDRSKQMQAWQKDMEKWQQQMQDWAKAQAQRSQRLTDPARGDQPSAPADIPPIPPMPTMPPIPVPAPFEEDVDVDVEFELTQPEVSVELPEIQMPHVEVPPLEPPAPPEVPENRENLKEVVVTRSLTLDAVEGEKTVEVANQMGSIAVRRGEGPGYKIVATIKGRAETEERARQIAERAELTSTSSPQGVRVTVALPDKLNNQEQHACIVELEVIAPRRAQIRLSQAMGDIRLAGLTGTIDAFAQMGSIQARNVTGDVSLKTNMGHIDFVAPEGLSAKVEAKSNMGSVQSDLPLETVKSAHPGMGGTASGVIGDGADNISLKTNMGSIRIRTQSADSNQAF